MLIYYRITIIPDFPGLCKHFFRFFILFYAGLPAVFMKYSRISTFCLNPLSQPSSDFFFKPRVLFSTSGLAIIT